MRKTFTIPALPPSLNKMYKINYRQRRCYLDDSVRQFKNKVIPFIPHIEVKDGQKLLVEVEYHGKFLNKDGSVKRRDGQNLDKALYDVIFEQLGVDDKMAWAGTWIKTHNEFKEFTKVTISTLER